MKTCDRVSLPLAREQAQRPMPCESRLREDVQEHVHVAHSVEAEAFEDRA